MNVSPLPVVVIGAGPVGLAAAVHLQARGIEPLVLEAGPSVGSGILAWSHVRMFSPWVYNIDAAARALLSRGSWVAPAGDELPTGRDVVERYLRPLASTPELAPYIRTGARVTAIARVAHDRQRTADRERAAFVVRFTADGEEHDVIARAVIDASGTIETPNPLGASGIPARGEALLRHRIYYGIPDVLGASRSRYAGRRTLVVGSGHSAFNVLLDLDRLAGEAPDTRIVWALRRARIGALGGGAADQLEERGRLGFRLQALVDSGRLEIASGFFLDALRQTAPGVVAYSGDRELPPVDEIVAVTGFRPGLSILGELRIDLDPATESPRGLAPLIDPNVHSCGTVPPHGVDELAQPEANFFVAGMKSYGRAPTFLLLTGYEQVRSIAAAIAGDWDAARRVELVLPETGVCKTSPDETGAGCCGGPAPAGVDACCVKDADAKSAGADGCGCGAPVTNGKSAGRG
ncbi:MAG: NAD(P)-binding domain-containing protein [Acidobacteriota bacterium]